MHTVRPSDNHDHRRGRGRGETVACGYVMWRCTRPRVPAQPSTGARIRMTTIIMQLIKYHACPSALHMRTCMHAQMHSQIYPRMHAHMPIMPQACAQAQANAYANAYANACASACAHACAYIPGDLPTCEMSRTLLVERGRSRFTFAEQAQST